MEPKRCKDIGALKEPFRRKLKGIIRDMKKAGFEAIVFETRRSAYRQAWLYNIGRLGVKGERPVTWVRHSRHEDGEAADVISKKYGWGLGKFFDELERVAKFHGCRTLERDRCHVELV